MKKNLYLLPKIKAKNKRRVGRGIGSTQGGHTTGRGQKGQKSRNKVGLLFMGTKVKKSLLQRLPALRGKNKFKSLTTKKITLSLERLNATFEANSRISRETLISKGILATKISPKAKIKVVGVGTITKPLIVEIPVTASAKAKIESVGGQVVMTS